MKTKNKSSKVPRAAKTRLSDLTPKKDARGGVAAPTPPIAYQKKKHPLSSSLVRPSSSNIRRNVTL